LLVLVLVEAVAIGLLGLLVAGLLRSHAEILRRLHELGAGLEPDPPTARPVRLGEPRATVRRPDPDAAPAPALVAGPTPHGEIVAIALDRPGERTLLLFLSSGCGTCAPFWDGLRSGGLAARLSGVRVLVVARDATEESPSLLAGLGGPELLVVLASEVWEAFGVPGSPYAVLVDGTSRSVIGQGVAHTVEQLAGLVGAHLGDLVGRGGGPGAGAGLDGPARERRADAELAAAGITPEHPSLHPAPGSWSAGRPS